MEFKSEKNSFNLYHGCDVVYTVYTPCDLPKGIVQIFHGSEEYMGRYSDFSEYLCKKGFIVCGCDMPGFGESENEEKCRGYFGKGKALSTPENAQKKLFDIMRSKYRYLPYMLYTTGIGAVVAKKFVNDYPDSVDGVVFGSVISGFDPVSVLLCKLMALFKGKGGVSKMLEKRFFNKGTEKFAEEKELYSYISSIKEERKKFQEDTLITKQLSVASMKQLAEVNKEFEYNRWNENFPAGVYTLIISGKNDPLSNYGKASLDMMDELQEFSSVCDIECVVYENSRHLLLRDVEREEVYQKCLTFFEKVVDGVNSARILERGKIF